MDSVSLAAENTDSRVDEDLLSYMNFDRLRSFFLYAGAGSGKTRSLVLALERFRDQYGERLRPVRKRVAVITYTNAACDEILERLDQDPLFDVSTIHSFCWKQIRWFHKDIQEWLVASIPNEIAELESQESRGRGGKASEDRKRRIAKRKKRLMWLQSPRQFTYNPNGDNFGKDSLNHSEVIKITSDFMSERPIMQRLLASQYPVLLIDESQDTNSQLVEALIGLEQRVNEGAAVFCLGLFGDMMQRIYGDGHPDLDSIVPLSWARPKKKMNHRSPRRVVQLANTIRRDVDGYTQFAREDNAEGIVRFYVCSSDVANKSQNEEYIRERMAEESGDTCWGDRDFVKTLTLEHRLSAVRMGFDQMYEPLYAESTLQTGLLDGTLAGVRLFSHYTANLERALEDEDDYAAISVLRGANSPALYNNSQGANHPLQFARDAVDEFRRVMSSDPSFMDVLQCVVRCRLFEVPGPLQLFAGGQDAEQQPEAEEDERVDSRTKAWLEFLRTPYGQIHAYNKYLDLEGPFDTHQGVKGREFPRVMVVMSDTEAKGFLFSYDKLLGAKPPSTSDKAKMARKEDTTLDRTARLFYVTCTRAKESLALVSYTQNSGLLQDRLITSGWFRPEEVIVVDEKNPHGT